VAGQAMTTMTAMIEDDMTTPTNEHLVVELAVISYKEVS
jgi:hypothetical protein